MIKLIKSATILGLVLGGMLFGFNLLLVYKAIDDARLIDKRIGNYQYIELLSLGDNNPGVKEAILSANIDGFFSLDEFNAIKVLSGK